MNDKRRLYQEPDGDAVLFGTGTIVKQRPDMLLVLTAAFGLGVIVTLMLPMSANSSVSAPPSPLQAGVVGSTVNVSR